MTQKAVVPHTLGVQDRVFQVEAGNGNLRAEARGALLVVLGSSADENHLDLPEGRVIAYRSNRRNHQPCRNSHLSQKTLHLPKTYNQYITFTCIAGELGWGAYFSGEGICHVAEGTADPYPPKLAVHLLRLIWGLGFRV